jgi:mono/diheme cytochrome c family protein
MWRRRQDGAGALMMRPQNGLRVAVHAMMRRRSLAMAGCVALVTATAGCPGTLSNPERFVSEDAGEAGGGGTCPDIPDFFATTCTASACHSSSNKAQGLDLQSPDVASRLVGISATEGPGLLIDPSSPSNSVIYLKLTANPPFGSRMPLAETPLDATTMACILTWIDQEASSADAAAAPTSDASNEDEGDAADATGPSEGTDAGSVTFSQVYSTILMPDCAGCHAPGQGGVTSGNLDMSTMTNAYSNLVGVMAMGSACGSKMETRVVKGSSGTSLLYTKVAGTQDCGSRMPDGQSALSATDIGTIKSWIDEGAPND